MGLSSWFHYCIKATFSSSSSGSSSVASLVELTLRQLKKKKFLSSFFIINIFRNHQKQEGESFAYMEPQVNAAFGQMRTLRVLFQVDIISILFCERVWVWNRGKNVTHASFKQKGSIALVRTDCGGMHIVLTWEHWEMDKRSWFRNTLLSCQSKLLSQKGRHTFHEMKQEWLSGGEVGTQEISALIPGVKFLLSFTWFHRPQLVIQYMHHFLLSARQRLHKLQPRKTFLPLL